jgi:hypothetical protein
MHLDSRYKNLGYAYKHWKIPVINRSNSMKKLPLALLAASLLVVFSSQAEAKGCVKGAVVGGVAGHVAHHGVAGAAAGCAVGHHVANKKQKEDKSTQQSQK